MSRQQEFLDEWHSDQDEDDFFLKVRIRSKWDQTHFERMVKTANAFLDEMEKNRHVDSKRWDEALRNSIDILIPLMMHPGFLAKNDIGLNIDAYRSYISERVVILESIRSRYEELRDRFASTSDPD